MAERTILITGGAGFIGSNLADALLYRGFSVVSVDNFDPFYGRDIKENNISQAQDHPKYSFYELDIRDTDALQEVLLEHRPHAVVHLAAKAGVRPSIATPEEYYDVNVVATLKLLQVMNVCGFRKMVFGSSSSVYGNSPNTPFSEEDATDSPISPYAASKKAAELLCHTFHHLHGFDIVCLRLFTVYGPRQRPDLAITKFTELMLENKPIPVYGDGTSARDYTYVTDVVEGIISSIERLKGYEVINIGESETITLSELIKELEAQVGKEAKLECQEAQQGDAQITYASIAKAQRLLNYRPKYSKAQGLAEFVSWKTRNR